MSPYAFREVRLTPHALDAMRRRRVEPEEVGAALREPDVTEPHDGSVRFVRGDLAVVVRLRDGVAVVLSVLLRCRSSWTDADVRTRPLHA